MPILVKEFEWDQTEKYVILQVPIKGVRHPKADIFISPRFVKATFEQYYFEMVLPYWIDERKSRATIDKYSVIFELRKTSDITWKTLDQSQQLEDKSLLKETLLEATWKELKKKDDERRSIKSELKKFAVRKQIETDTIARETIMNNKKKEEIEATGDISEWEKQLKSKFNIHRPMTSPSFEMSLCSPFKKLNIERPKPECDTVQVEFTPRSFSTPKRESKEADEIVFMKKQAEARRAFGFNKDDIPSEQRNPQYVEAKAREFMREENYYAAASAYSYGIELDPSSVECHMGRSRAHYAMGNLHKTLEDCTNSLRLLMPHTAKNRKERAECIARRGLTMYKLNLKRYARREISFSLKVHPDLKLQNFYETADFEDEN